MAIHVSWFCSSIASWSLVAIGVVMSLHVVGINVQPLLTVGGVSGVIVGLSAQSVMANLISGVNVVCSSPTSHTCAFITSCRGGGMPSVCSDLPVRLSC
jgi:xanthosine utilization system XapX-like protein